MTYNDRPTNAVYALNSYVWKLLEANLGWKKSDYHTGTPIIPVAQQPELMDTGKAFLVYGSAMHPAQHLYALRSGAVSYNVHAVTSTEANAVLSLLAETFERQDEAAADVNEWLAVEGLPGNRPTGKRQVSFTTVKATMSEQAEPADEEGGYVSGFIMLEIGYVLLERTAQTSGFVY